MSKTKKTIEEGEGKKPAEDGVLVAKSKLALIAKLLSNIKENSDQLSHVLSGVITSEEENMIQISQLADDDFTGEGEEESEGARVIEGVFTGENMIGPDGKEYSVPANYASKSKLVEGDIMKLTITANGTFVYKQIGPIERTRVVGALEKGADGGFSVVAEGKRWHVLTASVTYYKGQGGDEAVILVPKTGDSKWGAVENIIRKID